MIAPLFDAPAGVLAIPVGVAFGFTLERAGLGSARTIAAQLAARDFTVVKVMFAAIVTAMLGIFWADRLGWLDLSRVSMPETDVLPQLIGAALFGAGFAIASLCPGTACVSAATGKRDGFATIVGLFVGTLAVSFFWSQLGSLAERSPHTDLTLAASLGLPTGVVVAAIAAIGVAVLWGVDRLVGVRRPLRLAPLGTAALVLGGLAAASGSAPLASAAALSRVGAEVDSAVDHVDAVSLAEWIRAKKSGLRIIDVREGLAPDDYRIPGAEEVPVQLIPSLKIKSGETIVLYSDGGGHAAQAWMMLRLRGVPNAFVLRDGLEAWDEEILSPRYPDSTDATAIARFQYVRDLARYFGGRPTHEPLRVAPPEGAGPTARRRKAC